jgi:hypothetical protein
MPIRKHWTTTILWISILSAAGFSGCNADTIEPTIEAIPEPVTQEISPTVTETISSTGE